MEKPKNYNELMFHDCDKEDYPEDDMAIDCAIEALEREQCGDCISREAVMHILDEVGGDFDSPREAVVPIDYIADMVSELPSVTPQPKMGQWKAYTHSAYHGNDEYGEPIWREVVVYHCSECNRRTVIKENYCPNCGAIMKDEADA